MLLSELNAETNMEERHDTQRTAHLMIAIDTLQECWNGIYGTTEFIAELRRVAERITTLAAAVEKQAK